MPIYAGISLILVAIMDPANPSDVLYCGTQKGTSKTYNETLGGDFRMYAGGRTRLVTTTNISLQAPLTLENLSQSDKAWIRSKRGRTLLWRDTYGMRIWGAYLDTAITHHALSNPVISTVIITLNQVTVDERSILVGS